MEINKPIPNLKNVYKNGLLVKVSFGIPLRTLMLESHYDTSFCNNGIWYSTNPFVEILDEAPVAKPIAIDIKDSNHNFYSKSQYIFAAKPGQKWILYVVPYEILALFSGRYKDAFIKLGREITLVYNQMRQNREPLKELSMPQYLTFHTLTGLLGKPILVNRFQLIPESKFFESYSYCFVKKISFQK